jgi:hypothetical protein
MSTINVSNLAGPSNTGTAATLSSINGGPISGARNRIINGDMRIDQRNAGAAVTAGGSYPVDRFQVNLVGGGVVSFSRSTVAPAGFTNSLSATVTTPDSSIASADYYRFLQIIEGFNAADLQFGTASASPVVVSFWVRSSVTGTYSLGLQNNSSNRSYAASYAISAANTWELKTLTIPGDTSGTWLTDNSAGIRLFWDLGSGSSWDQAPNTWSATNTWKSSSQASWISTNGATFYITGVQLEAGTVATPFERRSYGQELSLCQRYFYRMAENTHGFTYPAASVTIAELFYKASMRSLPTISYAVGTGSVSNTQIATDKCVFIGASFFVVNFTASAEL